MPNAKHKVFLLKEAQKDLDKLDYATRNKVLAALKRTEQNPSLAKRLTGNLSRAFSYRFGTAHGEFRMVFVKEGMQLIVIAIGPRGKIYKTLHQRYKPSTQQHFLVLT